MKNTAFLFPGQGSQYVGMGKDLFERSEFGEKTFKQANEILGYDFMKICFEGPEEELKLTHNTQPALLTVSYILYNLLEQEPALGAGHSLGEYSAVLCAGGIDFEDAVMLVHKRGKYMQEAVPVGEGAMAAIIGLDIDHVRDNLKNVGGVVNIANWNSASQIVISGSKKSVEDAVELLAAPKSVMLPVSAPFHSDLMLPAEEKLSSDLDKVEFRNLKFPIINNVDVEKISEPGKVRGGLRRQVSRPVLWHSAMLQMLNDTGINNYAEIGSGKVLAGLIKRTAREISREINIVNYQNIDDLDNR